MAATLSLLIGRPLLILSVALLWALRNLLCTRAAC